MPWLQITVQALKQDVARYEQALLDAGALSVTLEDAADQPLLEPLPGETPLWNAILVSGLFESHHQADAIKKTLCRILQTDHLPNLSAKTLPDQDWQRVWMDRFKPQQFGDRLWVVPNDMKAPQSDAIELRLDPGLAFGTGDHETTRLCLQWLASHDLTGKKVIDYGCGSGILAISCALLGASQVWAVDIDHQALLATEQNALNNQVKNHIQISGPSLQAPFDADMIIANILANPLMEMAQQFAQWLPRDAPIVLSGIVEDQSDAVKKAYQPWFEFIGETRLDQWLCLEAILI